MTRLGPLTAQALGRSPYDDEVLRPEADQEEGPSMTTSNSQQYDGRGRPVNPETRRMNRDMIRAHNEVMQVIGVAEPDTGPSHAELEATRRYIDYEEVMGQRLLRIGRALEVAGVWGVNGFRARILVYRRYADISFFDLFRHERAQRSVASTFLTGLPTFLAGHALKLATHFWAPLRRRRRMLSPVLAYIRVHLQLYVFMQRVEIIPASKWFPSWTFFIPGLPSSPIPAPAPPEDFSAASLMRYAGAWAINAMPFASFVLWGHMWTRVTSFLWQEFYGRLPNTVHHRKNLPPVAPAAVMPDVADEEPSQPPVEEPMPQHSAEGDLAGQDTTPNTPLVRRPSVFSSRGDDFGSDDEDEAGISATLISFDVEATDATDAPPGLWSAELRPSAGAEGGGSGSGGPVAPPIYIDTMLTRLPACLASDIFTVITSYVVVAPYEAMALRLVARSYRQSMGLPFGDIYEPNIFHSITWRGALNFVGIEFLHLSIAGELWAMVTLMSQVLHLTEEEFREMDAAAAAEARAANEEGPD
ncbi:hypothetical protein F5X68DRAFT_204052 [Plectosphaerella plurivora]|uniref:Uncharacterized protein n=1 Tax=Plectosphaerella plurivora TaxID=936078 RepID=A0A9P9A9W5_9PEZI|nr:hypothetical protein F5X68DRAFT_204052 [Plectosphaerella plurivora]